MANKILIYNYRLSNKNSNKTDRDLRFSGRASSYSYIYNKRSRNKIPNKTDRDLRFRGRVRQL